LPELKLQRSTEHQQQQQLLMQWRAKLDEQKQAWLTLQRSRLDADARIGELMNELVVCFSPACVRMTHS
jgi:hypothetical protein